MCIEFRCRKSILEREAQNEKLVEALKLMEDADLIAFYILYELSLGDSSFWAPYLSTLPAYVPVLYTWSEKNLGFLWASVCKTHGEILAQSAQKLRFSLRKSYESYSGFRNTLIPGHTDVSLSAEAEATSTSTIDSSWLMSFTAWVWVHSIVDSRALSIEGKRYLVPFADMHNFLPQEESRVQNAGASFLNYHKLTSRK